MPSADSPGDYPSPASINAQPHFVIGTAGHIDHGKSSLVKALTGIDPDRLEEEKRRGMTIDLGFAHLDLSSGRRVGIVDVPGHERLIKNMLAGAGGLDAVLLVVAADEGVMPQTREHLDILRFLRVHRGVVILTKADLVEDEEWLALVEQDVDRLVSGSFLDGAPVLRVSARTGAGLDALIREIEQLAEGIAHRNVHAPARLPIDRVFTMPGFGTVVTGTLWSGRIRAGETLSVLPAETEVRIRQLQRHGERVEEIPAGSRAALNLVGVDRGDLERGMVLTTPHAFRTSTVLDVRLRMLPDAPALGHLGRVRFYLGTDEVMGRVVLLDRQRLEPGEEGPAQVRLERPAVAARGDAFVIRRYSPAATLGGGDVLGVGAPRRKRGMEAAVALEALAHGGLPELVISSLTEAGLAGRTAEEVASLVGEVPERVVEQILRLAGEGKVLQIRDRLFDADAVAEARAALLEFLQRTHTAAPWRLGVPREEVKVRTFTRGDDRLFTHIVEQLSVEGKLEIRRNFLHLSGHRPSYNAGEQRVREALLGAVAGGRFSPPSIQEAAAGTGLGAEDPVVLRMGQSLIETGELVEVAPGIVFTEGLLREIEGLVVSQLSSSGGMTVAQLRDVLGTSRKYALALMEHFDRIKLTRRLGDRRVLGVGAPVRAPLG